MYEIKWRREASTEIKDATLVSFKYPEAVQHFEKNLSIDSAPKENSEPIKSESTLTNTKDNVCKDISNSKYHETGLCLSTKENSSSGPDSELHKGDFVMERNENLCKEKNLNQADSVAAAVAETTSQDWSMEDTNKWSEQMDVDDLNNSSNKESQSHLETEETQKEIES
jgi:hypothetical protein